ncbi:putative phosphoribosylpyrophosphate synthetase [Trypanosoma grayi]|uniref:putative phosphoribosylpyrophosphate synthetase n=1 Tax=Trypanosoma grayi TaxID=71804 RepID=UPI0004F4116A|nr:putative phosphoribosylpyrophosphate synthetase [Trypanosoma grayi]KEG08296.1 putative phosphoribosylpyrophosphate synthetase [Trypanosoma grayi]
MSIAVVLPTVFTAEAADAEATVVGQLNALFRHSGLHFSTASTQLHIMPETVHILSYDDVAMISRYARVLVTNKDVQCDFNALCGVLWGHTKDGEDALDRYMQQTSDVDDRQREVAVRRLVPHLLLQAQVFHTLRCIEEPFARQEVRDAVNVVQKDVETVLRLAMKVLRVLDGIIKCIRRGDANFLWAAELCLGSAEMFVAAVSARHVIDVDPVVKFFNSDMAWRLSGIGIVSTECYCQALYHLICTIFVRQESFAGVSQVAVQLLLHRLADRPPFDWETFKLVSSLPKVRMSVGPLTPQCGVLNYMSLVQRCVESLLLCDAPWVKTLKRGCSHALREMNEQKKTLSFFQVPILGALQGMPEVDLSDDGQLRRRAAATHLSNNENILNPNFLRILLSHGYTIPHDNHSPLSRASLMALFRAITDELLQIPLIRSGETTKLTDALLRPPILTARLLQLVVDEASQDAQTASDVMKDLHHITEVVFDANAAQYAKHLSARTISRQLRRVSTSTVELLFTFLASDAFLANVDRRVALESLAKVFAVWAFYISVEKNVTEKERKKMLQLIARMGMRLMALTQMMTAPEINEFFKTVVLPCSSSEEMKRKNRLQYALLEAYTKAYACSAVALAMEEDVMLRHWVDTALRCIHNDLSGALSVAGMDFLAAAFLSRRSIAPLFVPTYVTLLVPIASPSRYGEPPLFLVRRFAKSVRAVCQALEECDEDALLAKLQSPNSSVKKFLVEMCGEGRAAPQLDNVRPVSSVLLIVSALFEKVCRLLGYAAATTSTKERLARFQAYFSALINLLRCRTSTVLHRVCASVEAIILEHLHGVPSAQALWMKYISTTVDSLDGSSKKGVAEWFLKLSEKANKTAPQARL